MTLRRLLSPFPVALAALVLAAAATTLPTGCGAVNAACQTVDTAEHAGTVLRYLGADGGVEEVRISREEAAAFGRLTTARRLAEAKAHDAGAP